MDIHDFKKKFDGYYELINSTHHTIDKKIRFYEKNIDLWLEVDEMILKHLPGCQCEYGLTITLKRDD